MSKKSRKGRNLDSFIQGSGNLDYATLSPPGTGRKVKIPFYLEDVVTGFQVMTPTGLQPSSTIAPTILLGAPTANGATNTAILRTPQIPFAVLQFAGFETKINSPSIPNQPVMDICFSDLKLGGATNIFVHEEFASGKQYVVGGSNPGFRSNPIIIAPNRMEVSVQGIGLTTSTPIGFSCIMICDVLDDDEYGQHISGAYLRPEAKR